MTKEQILDTIKLLSALEGWGYSEKCRLPIGLLEELDRVVVFLGEELLK